MIGKCKNIVAIVILMYEQDLLDPTKLLNRRISQLENELDYYKTLTKEYKQKIELEQIANHDLRLQNIALEKIDEGETFELQTPHTILKAKAIEKRTLKQE